MASPAPSTPSQRASESERRTQSLDAAGLLSWSYMKASRRILRDDMPAIRRAVNNCETEEQKRRFLSRIRVESEASYLAYCHYWPEDVVGGSEDSSAFLKRADYAYVGPYVKPWDYGSEKRTLERDEFGNTVSVKQRQDAFFGAWTRSWQDGPSLAEEDLLRALGPMEEVASVEVLSCCGLSWSELGEMQGRKRREYERMLERQGRRESEWMGFVRRLLKRLRGRLSISKAKVGEEEEALAAVEAAKPVKASAMKGNALKTKASTR